jgi:hypothetical protein
VHRRAKQCNAQKNTARQRNATTHGTGEEYSEPFIEEAKMAIQQAAITITGMDYLLQNNPQTVDPFNHFAKAMKKITAKRTGKTEDDLIELGNIETESKIYFDDNLGVYVPSRWLTEAICRAAFSVIKIGKDRMRGGIFATDGKAKLSYEGMGKVKTITDVVRLPEFRHRALLPQGAVRIAKDFPIFKNWSFSTVLEFDDTVIDLAGLRQVTERTAKYVGFGDFRPTFGRATAEVQGV